MIRYNDKLFYRSLDLQVRAVDEGNRTVQGVIFSTDAPAARFFGPEILLHGENNVDLGRLQKMGSVLVNHDPDRLVGPVRAAILSGNRGLADIGFDDDGDDAGAWAWKKYQHGSLRGVSVGYMVHEFRELRPDEEWEGFRGPCFLATRWEPYEISLTPIPLDAQCEIGRDATRSLAGIRIQTATGIFTGGRKMDVNERFEKVDQALEALRAAQPTTEKLADLVAGAVKAAGLVSGVVTDFDPPAGPAPVVDIDTARDLRARAHAAGGDELREKVTDLYLQGRAQVELEREISSAMLLRADAVDLGDTNQGVPVPAQMGADDVLQAVRSCGVVVE